MTITVRPRVSPLWHRLGFIHIPAAHGESERYIGHIKFVGYRTIMAIDVNLNGTTATWLYDPPQKLKDHHCFLSKKNRIGRHGWWVVHYDEKSPTTFEEAFSSICQHAERIL